MVRAESVGPVPAVLRERLPARPGPVHLRGRDELGDDGPRRGDQADVLNAGGTLAIAAGSDEHEWRPVVGMPPERLF